MRLIILFIVISFLIGYLVGINKDKILINKNGNNQPTQVIQSFKPIFKTDYALRLADDYTLKLVNSNGLSVKDEDLLPLRCSEDFSEEFDSEIMNKIRDTLPGYARPSSAKQCQTKDDRNFLFYTLSYRGGGTGSDTYFSILGADGRMSRSIIIPDDKSAYFRCPQVIQYTKTNQILVECYGQEGSLIKIYKVDLASNNYALVYSKP